MHDRGTFENVAGAPKDDWIEGNSLDNLLYGMAGKDVIDAGSGPAETDQKVDGGSGNDVCRGSGVPNWPGCER